MLVLEADQTVEWEFRALTDLSGVAVYHTRLASEVIVTPDTPAMQHSFAADGINITAIGSFDEGDDTVVARLTKPPCMR